VGRPFATLFALGDIMNDQSTLPPNLRLLADALCAVGLAARWSVAQPPISSPSAAARMTPGALLSRIELLALDMTAIQVGLESALTQCFGAEAARMHADEADPYFVHAQVLTFQREIDRMLELRRSFAGMRVESDFEAVRRMCVRVVDGQIEQFARFAADLPGRLDAGMRGGEHVQITLALNPTNDLRYLERALRDAMAAHRRSARRYRTSTRSRRRWGWLGWVVLVVALAWREFNKLPQGTYRRR